MDIDDVTEGEFPRDVREYLVKARIHEGIDSISDLKSAGFWYMKAADRLQDVDKIRAVGKYYEKAATFYSKAAQRSERQDKKGDFWHAAYSLYTQARAAYTQFGFNRYSVGRIYIKETDALRKANKYHKEFAKWTIRSPFVHIWGFKPYPQS